MQLPMSDQLVITEKTSQARDVRAAVGSRYGAVLPAEGHLFDLAEPEDAVPAWKRWSTVLLRPPGLYATKPAGGGTTQQEAARDGPVRQLRAEVEVGSVSGANRFGGHGRRH